MKKIGEAVSFVKSINPDIIVMVDNCYGEFVETIEPSDVGADMVVGSLIKNPGGGLAEQRTAWKIVPTDLQHRDWGRKLELILEL